MIKIFKAILNWKYIYRFTLAGCWLMVGKVDRAIPIFQNLLKKYPNDGPVLAIMGRFLIEQGEIENGVNSLKESLKWIQKEDKHLSEIYAYLGYGSLMINNYEEAIDYNLAALDCWNESHTEFSKEQIYANLGLAYEGENNFDCAIESYDKGLSVNPQDISLYERLVRAYYINGAYYEAKQKLNQMLSIDPTLENDDKFKQAALNIEKEIGKGNNGIRRTQGRRLRIVK